MELLPVEGLPEIRAGDDLAGILAERLSLAHGLRARDGDILVVTQKVVSKAENRFVDLAAITPSSEACELASAVRKDPALVELVLRESDAVIRQAPNVLIARHRLGHVMANAGIDASNVGGENQGKVLLLPDDPDASAAAIRSRLATTLGVTVAVVISDSFGRPWRLGTTDVAIGVAGMLALTDQRGELDRDGRVMEVTQVAVADAIAAAAGLVMGEGSEGIPAVIVRGWSSGGTHQKSAALLRPVDQDLFQ